MNGIAVSRHHIADRFDFAHDEIHVCPEREEGFRLSGTVPES